jgi:hypothetical protein
MRASTPVATSWNAASIGSSSSTRYAKRAAYFRAEITVAAAILWLRQDLQDTP